ncbi:DUF6641 family protein [Magnetospirillum sp. 15-1]|uniref:DUF6641 family protein n=1 Tax=Magnetospirillum sp. 15-1 TaxID=1979370 RepID=UPI001F5B89E6|nr:DUF6641 family protein [Magnetospirillum sp. 15-1]
MTVLNFKFSDAKRPLVADTRKKSGREVVLDGIEQQMKLLNDPSFRIERTKYIKDEAGNSVRKTICTSPRPWWWQVADGIFMVQVKYGHSVVVELEVSKPTIVAGKSEKDVVAVLTQVSTAIKEGKFDAQIAVAKEKAKRNRQAQADQAAA